MGKPKKYCEKCQQSTWTYMDNCIICGEDKTTFDEFELEERDGGIFAVVVINGRTFKKDVTSYFKTQTDESTFRKSG